MSRRPRTRFARLAFDRLEDRLAPAVYYFHGHNLFGPNDGDGDAAAWGNPFNWGKDTDEGLLSGQGVPGPDDTAVFKGSTEDGKAWRVDDPNSPAFAFTFGANATGGGSVQVLNLDRNWGGTINAIDASVQVAGGRWQSGVILGNVHNTGSLTIAPDAGGAVYSALGTFSNTGTVSQSGTFVLGLETGALPYAGFLDNSGTYTVSSGRLTRASNPDSLAQNRGILTGAGEVQVATVTGPAGTLSGSLTLTGPQTVSGGTVTGSGLTFAGTGSFPYYGSVTFAGKVIIGGAVAVHGGGRMNLDDATFTVAGTAFTVGVPSVLNSGLGRTEVHGSGKLAAGSLLTVVSGDFVGNFENDGTVVLAGVAAPSGLYEDNRLYGLFQNDGVVQVQAPAVYMTGAMVNTDSARMEFQKTSNWYGAGGVLQNLGTVRVNSGANVYMRAALDNLGGTLDVQGNLSVTNSHGPDSQDPASPRGQVFTDFGAARTAVGISTGGTFAVATGSTLDLRSGDFFSPGGVFAGRYTGSGGGRLLIGGNMQMIQSDWNFPPGMLQWGASDEQGTSRLTGTWQNSGDLTLPATPAQVRSLRYGTLFNTGTVNFGAGAQLYLNEDFQPGNSNLANLAGGLVAFAGGNTVRGYGPNNATELFNPDYGGQIHNAGLFRFDGGGANLSAIVDNTTGTFDARNAAGVSVVWSRGLNPGLASQGFAGRWLVSGGAVIDFPGVGGGNGTRIAPATFRGEAVLDGVGSQLPWLTTVVRNEGTITVRNGATVAFTPTAFVPDSGDLTNAGRITLAGGTISVAKSFTQSATGILDTGVTANAVTATGKATLGGTFVAAPPAGFVPPSGFSVDVLTAGTVAGNFGSLALGGLVSRVTPTTVSLNTLADAADLAVSDVELLPAGGDVAPGTPLSVRFTVRNLSSRATSAGWTDAVYLSGDSRVDARDVRLARQAEADSLPGYGSRTVTVPFAGPAVPGAWQVLVVTDSTAAVPDPFRTNNTAAASAPLRITAPELPIGVNVTVPFPVGDTTYYRLTRPFGGPPLRLTAPGAFLAVRFAVPPTGDTADATGSSQLNLPTTAGVYYLAVTRTAGAVTLRANVAGLAISALGDEAHLSAEIRVGDPLTLTVHGTGFTPTTTFRLGEVLATAVEVRDPTTAVVTFTVPTAGGPLFVGATSAGTQVTYSGKGFTAVVSDAGAAEFDKLANWGIQVDLPAAVRAFRQVRGTVTFRNTSAVSQPAPLLVLAATNATVRLPSMADGVSWASLTALGVKATGRPDSYAPGETGSVEFVAVPTVFGAHDEFEVAVSVVPEQTFVSLPGEAVGPRQGVMADVPLPAGFVAGLRPTGIPQDAWDAQVGPNLATLLGPTTRSYADAVRIAADTLAGDEGDVRDVSRLVGYLTTVADNFGAVSRRFRATAFGRGMTNSLTLTATPDGPRDVVVTNGGSSRRFVPAAPGRWVGQLGDRGILDALTSGGYTLTEADGSVTVFRPDGQFERITDRQGRATLGGYDAAGRLVTLTDFRGDITRLTYTPGGRVASVTDPVGWTTTYTYDPTGQMLTATADPAGTTTLEYGPNYAITAVTGSDGVRTELQYDAAGRLVAASVGGQSPTTFAYTLGTVAVTDPSGSTARYTRGEFGQLTRLEDPLARLTTTTTDADANTTAVSGPGGTVGLPVDADGNLTAVIAPNGDPVRFGYDPAGIQLVTIVNPLGHRTDYGYDTVGRVTERTDPLGTSQYSYTAAGDLRGYQSPGGRWMTNTTDAHGLVVRRDYADGSATIYQYDARRNLIGVTDADAGGANPRSVGLVYDAADRLTQVTYPDGRTVGYTYDTGGRRIGLQTSDGLAVGYTYDAAGRLATVSRGGVLQVTYSYDAVGRLAAKAFANGVTARYTYDAAGQATRIENRQGPALLSFEAYTYDALGRVATRNDLTGTTAYTYDAIGQLVGVTRPDGSTQVYQYDAAGNRIGYGATASDQYTVTPTGGVFAYDTDGNLVSVTDTGGQTQTRYSYDIRGRLVSQTGQGGTVRYEYDPLGGRSVVVAGGVRTDRLLDPLGGLDGLNDVLTETTAGSTTTYLIGLGLEARSGPTGDRFLLADLQGNVTELTDQTGAVTAGYQYDPFGAVAAQSGAEAAANPLRFNGTLGVWDRGSGLLEMRNRFYDPATGRFTQRDPIGLTAGDTNLYRFAGNDPVNFVDPSGLADVPWWQNPNIRPGDANWQAHQEAEANRLQNTNPAPTDDGIKSPPPTGPTTQDRINRINTDSNNTKYSKNVPQSIRDLFKPNGGGGGGGMSALSAGRSVLGVAGYFFKRFNPVSRVYGAANDGWWIGTQLRRIPGVDDGVLGFFKPFVTPPPQDVLVLPPGTVPPVRQRIGILTADDPNDIVGPAGYGPEGFVQPMGDFGYMVRFQNKPTATAPAQVVIVTQQLDADLDWSTFQLAGFGWAANEFTVPAGRTRYHTRVSDPARNAIVDVDARFDPATGSLTWTLTTLDPETLDQPLDSVEAGFLPPDDASGVGQGFVRYTIRPRAGVPTGTRFDAQARIVFDTNAPLDTPAIVNTADRGAPAATVAPLPADSAGPLTVAWSGADDTGGSGLDTYTVFASVNGGAWAPWLTNTAATSGVFPGSVGDRVRFYVVSDDHVGLQQATPATAQASTRLTTNTVPPVTPPTVPPVSTRLVAVGTGAGGSPVLTLLNSTGGVRQSQMVFDPASTGGLRVAVGDFNTDGVEDYAVATGPGSVGRVRVIDGRSGADLFTLQPFEDRFLGGLFVAVGDLTDDGVPELVISPDEGGGPRVRVFNGKGFAQVADFFGIDDRNFRGGARAAVGDINGDGVGDLVVAAGFGGGPRVALFDGTSAVGGEYTRRLTPDFYAFEDTLRNGVYIAAGDLDGDGRAELIAGGGPGGGPRVSAFSGAALLQNTQTRIADFFAGDPTSRGGVRLVVKELDGDSRADLVAGAGTGAGSRVTAYTGRAVVGVESPNALFAVDAVPGFTGGVFVG